MCINPIFGGALYRLQSSGVLYISVSQPVGRGQLSMGLQSSHFAMFYCKTV